MLVGAAQASSTSPQKLRFGVARERPAAVAFSLAVTAVAVTLVMLDADRLIAAVKLHWRGLSFWFVLVVVVNLFPVAFGQLRLCLDMPVLMAVAVTYEPATACALAAVAAVDSREFGRKVRLSRAVFNRAQVALSVFVASLLFHQLISGPGPWPLAIGATAAALVSSFILNVLLVTIYASLRLATGPEGTSTLLRTALAVPFLGTYLGYGLLGLVLARLFVNVGAWSVASFVLPILVARAMLVRAQTVELLADRLRSREHLLEALLDRMVDERRDERLRIGGELHDEVLESLTSMRMSAHLIAKQAIGFSANRSVVAQDAARLAESADRALLHLRGVIHDLQESPLGRGGLVPTLKKLTRDLESEWGIQIKVDAPADVGVGPEVQTVAYQIAREAALNALKHARPRLVSISVVVTGVALEVVVSDDGIGFGSNSDRAPSHFGLGLMKERMDRARGELTIATAPGAGTTVRATFPLPGQSPETSPEEGSNRTT